jgi:hypothetical protein
VLGYALCTLISSNEGLTLKRRHISRHLNEFLSRLDYTDNIALLEDCTSDLLRKSAKTLIYF